MLSLRRAARRRSRCRGADHRSASRRRAITARRLLPTADVAVPAGCPAPRADRTDARQGRRGAAGRGRLPVRAEVGRFRALVFRRARRETAIQSRDLREFDRYFPELHAALAERLPRAASSTARSSSSAPTASTSTPCSSACTRRLPRRQAGAGDAGVVRRLRPAGAAGRSLMASSQGERRAALEQLLEGAQVPLHLTPATRDRAVAAGWLREFEGAGLDGVIAKPAAAAYQPGKRAMLKIKHQRTADCVVAGLRWHKSTTEGGPEAVGSLLLGLFDAAGRLHHVGITASFTMARRRELAQGAGAAAPQRPHRPSVGRPAPSPPIRTAPRRRSACPAPSAAGAPARTCPGCRCGRSGSAKCATTTSRAIASATPPRFFAGGPTSRPGTAATTSSRSSRLTP